VRLVRFLRPGEAFPDPPVAGGRTGLLTDTPDGPAVVDVGASLATLASVDPAGEAHLRAALNDTNWAGLIEGWDSVKSPLETLLARAGEGDQVTTFPAADVRLLPPVAAATVQVFALGGNFVRHVTQARRSIGREERPAAEADQVSPIVEAKLAGRPPWGFNVLPGTIIGPDATLTPPAPVHKLDYEGEVAVLLGRGGRSLTVDDVRIWGITAWNDFSVRDQFFGLLDLDRGTFNWTLQKNFQGGNACGPCVVVDEGLDPANMQIRVRVNGEVRQDGTTADMVYTYEEAAAHVSEYLGLRPGDMVTSGTPAGTAVEAGEHGSRWLAAGDVTEVEVVGVGVLRTTVGGG
jgi:2-keto-4-pentenoate hydratase/2-oxohepta-3-ene-1,7-dioic acid hydratase in catechol pathway